MSARSRGHTRSRPVLAVVVAVALAAPACGGGPADGDDEAVSTSTVPPSSISEDPPFFEAEPLPLLPTTTTPPVELGVDPPPPVPDPAGPPGRNSVMVVGDSVLMGTARSIPEAVPDWLVTYDAVPNRRLAQAVELLEERRDEIGEAVVICLGNNYIEGERGDYASQVEEVMALLWFVPRVVWVTVPEVNPGRDRINESIREAATRWPNMRVADWAPMVAADPTLASDGMHLTREGRRALAELIAATLGPVGAG